ncbi:MAG TPA: peroxidase family protein [Rhodopila sp.]|uniref:peroxidase family protein n=1 Tax=Rhodopila sp. TaxID=2480087 RepID=UPI002B8588C7|nr:peroxidase family protein [Rhodopila sp.]HVY16082.1 peroxidase family protein [Rhodopila sp.]
MAIMSRYDSERAETTAKAVMLAHSVMQNGGLPLTTAMTALAMHGGMYSMLNRDMLTARLTPMAAALTAAGHAPAGSIASLVSLLQSKVENYFIHLVPNKPYKVHSNLVSHIAFPGEGVTYTPKSEETNNPSGGDSINLPAAFTFVGQFIDHDLTANALDLFVPQTGLVVDEASPLIDLDSVYGPRVKTPPSQRLDLKSIYDSKDRFYLQTYPDGTIDVPRDPCGTALLPDKRNDENQMVNQVHQLLMRLHNKFINQGFDFEKAHRETVFTWQSIVLNDYLPKIVDANLIELKKQAIKAKDHGKLRHYPKPNPVTGRIGVQMPHEFAIGFRFGHSQLRPSYAVSEGNVIPLFNNMLPLGATYGDLRGGQALQKTHVIDWHFFLGGNGDPPNAVKSKLIDTKVTSVVFDLPESTIPDDLKSVGNLPQRNLVRSDDLGLCAGEDLARLYDVTPLTPEEVEPRAEMRALFEQDGGTFRTPLWYYVLREAELKGQDGKLGDAGGSLVAEVILGGIYYNDPALVLPDDWKSDVNGTGVVTLYELTQFVTGPANDAKVMSDPFVPPKDCLMPDPVTLTQK